MRCTDSEPRRLGSGFFRLSNLLTDIVAMILDQGLRVALYGAGAGVAAAFAVTPSWRVYFMVLKPQIPDLRSCDRPRSWSCGRGDCFSGMESSPNRRSYVPASGVI